MKNKRITYIIYIMLVIIIVTLFVLIKYLPVKVENRLLYKKWYKYDTSTGYYNMVYVENNKFTYNKPGNTNVRGKYDYCSKYTYDKSKKVFKLDCGEKITLDSVNDNKLVLIINDKKNVFYSTPEESLNYEFENYFNKSVSKYKTEKSQNIDFVKINYERLLEIISEKDNSTVIFLGSNCSSIECTLFLDVLEKWITINEKVYYVDVEKLTDQEIEKIGNIVPNFNKNREYYNDIYPRIILFKENRILDQYQIKCKGFNCTKYIKY